MKRATAPKPNTVKLVKRDADHAALAIVLGTLKSLPAMRQRAILEAAGVFFNVKLDVTCEPRADR